MKKLFLFLAVLLLTGVTLNAATLFNETLQTRRGSTYIVKAKTSFGEAWPYASQWFIGYEDKDGYKVEGNQYDNDYTNVTSYRVSVRGKILNGAEERTVGLFFAANKEEASNYVKFEGSIRAANPKAVLHIEICSTEADGGDLATMVLKVNDQAIKVPATTLGDQYKTSEVKVALPNKDIEAIYFAFDNVPSEKFISRFWITDDGMSTAYFVEVGTNNDTYGGVYGGGYYTEGENVTLIAIPNDGYHFVSWNDGTTDNPHTIEVTQDGIFTAEFAKNTYTITTQANNAEWGSTSGDASVLYLDNAEIAATANYGYHFVKWSDSNTDNPRIITVTKDETYTAVFAKNIYSINKIADNGVISGPSQAEYLDNVTLTAVPNYGYHFVQWSDGLKDNPRIFVLTQDTTFTAEFAIDKSGTCGDNNALTWEYDAEIKTLTIKGEGDLCSNYTFGVEAPNEMTDLIISEGVTAIGNGAFANQRTLRHISIAASVKTIYEQAFYNCTGMEHIYSYREKPSVAYSNTFDGIDKFECILYVLAASVDLYKAATGWRDFYYIETLEVTIPIDTVAAVPQNVWICETELPYNWSPIPGKVIPVNAEGTYHDTIPALADYRVDIFTLNLAVNKKLVDQVKAEAICEGDSYDWKDAAGNLIKTVSAADKYEHTVYYLDETGAPTTCVKEHYELTLSFFAGPDTIRTEDVVCEDADYEWKDAEGKVLKTFEAVEADIIDTVRVAHEGSSCLAHVYTLSLKVEKLVTYEDKVEVNVGDTFSWFGNEYVITKNEEFDKYFTDNITGCDTAHYHTIVTVLPRYTIDVTANNLEYGTVEGSGTFPPKTSVTISATPNSGYHFVQWSDGNTDNPRTIILTQDTTFTAQFDLISYPVIFLDYNGAVLSEQSVAYNSAATAPEVAEREGYRFIGWSADIEHITANTFAIALYEKKGINITYKDTEGEVIASEEVDIHIPDAPIIEGSTFAGWLTEAANNEDGIILRATYSLDHPTVNDDVTVEPGSTSVGVSFPYISGTLTYVLVVRDLFGFVVCKIMFNATGHLLGVAFAPGHKSAQQAQTEGFQFTVEGLTPSTTYEYEFVAHDETDAVIEKLASSFTTTEDVTTEMANSEQSNAPQKILHEGIMYILKNGEKYNAQGARVE